MFPLKKLMFSFDMFPHTHKKKVMFSLTSVVKSDQHLNFTVKFTKVLNVLWALVSPDLNN